MCTIKEIFEKETKLKLRKTSCEGIYSECSGVSYRNICNKISNFNINHNTNVFAIDDDIKDITFIHIKE